MKVDSELQASFLLAQLGWFCVPSEALLEILTGMKKLG